MQPNRQFTIIGLGEVLWDMFPEGPRFGGAPANFACHAAALGGRACLVSAVGSDELGDLAMQALDRQQVDAGWVAGLDGYPTGQVQVDLDGDGQARFAFGEDEAWDHLDWSDDMAALARRSDAVCFGTLGQRAQPSRQVIQRFVRATPDDSLRIFDVNLRPPFVDGKVIDESLGLANVLKLNEDELPVLACRYALSGSDTKCMQQLMRRFHLRLGALTRGERGSILVRLDAVDEFPGIDVAVQDTVGAGDAFTAALTLGLLQGHDLRAINRHASQVAAFVCSQSGATPKLPEVLRTTVWNASTSRSS